VSYLSVLMVATTAMTATSDIQVEHISQLDSILLRYCKDYL